MQAAQDTDIYEAQTHNGGWTAHIISPDERAELSSSPPTINDLVLAASLLARVPRTRVDVISKVLQFAGFIVAFDVEKREHRKGSRNMNVEYLRLDIPEEATLRLPLGMSISKCHEVVVQCASHDQGWADQDHEHDGTYAASYTWSELAVAKNAVDGGGEVARTIVCPNVRVVDSSRHHVRYFRSPSDVLDHVAPGSSLQLMLRSQYRGWSNSADYGRLRVQFFVEIDEEFEFLSPTEIVLALPSEPIQL